MPRASKNSLPGIAALSVAVPDETGAMAGALLLAGPMEQFTEENLARWLPKVRQACEQLSRTLYQ